MKSFATEALIWMFLVIKWITFPLWIIWVPFFLLVSFLFRCDGILGIIAFFFLGFWTFVLTFAVMIYPCFFIFNHAHSVFPPEIAGPIATKALELGYALIAAGGGNENPDKIYLGLGIACMSCCIVYAGATYSRFMSR